MPRVTQESDHFHLHRRVDVVNFAPPPIGAVIRKPRNPLKRQRKS